MILYVWPKYETMLRGLGKQTAIRSLRAHIGEIPPLEVMKPWHLEQNPRNLFDDVSKTQFFWLAAQSNSLKGVTETPMDLSTTAQSGVEAEKGEVWREVCREVV